MGSLVIMIGNLDQQNQGVVQCTNQLLEVKVKKDTPGQSCLSQKKQEEAQKKVQPQQVTKRGGRMSKR